MFPDNRRARMIVIRALATGATAFAFLLAQPLQAAAADGLQFRAGQHQVQEYRNQIERRVVQTVDIAGDARYEEAAAIAPLLRNIIERHAPVRFGRAHLKEFSAAAFRYEVVYFILDPDFNTSMDIQQSINLAMLREFRERGIRFAYPTQAVLLGGAATDGAARRGMPAGSGAEANA